MNNLKKLGLTALAGSLVAVNANAGEMSVSGGFNATYVSTDGNTGTATTDHGVGLGNDKDFGVSGSGELDNGWTFAGNTAMKEAGGFDISSSALSLTMGSMGTVTTGSGFGGSSTKYDEQTPKAYEEIDDMGGTTLSANIVGSWLDNNSLVYNSPSFDLMGFSASFDVEYSPEATGTSPNDGGTQHSTEFNNGRSLGVTLSGNGLTVGVYGAERENDSGTAADKDEFNGVWYANYSMGPVAVGYSASYYDAGQNVSNESVGASKVVGTAGGLFETEMYSIAFNVNDNLSVSYGKASDTYDNQSHNSSGTEDSDVDMDLKSIQMSYTMGSMSINAQRTETDNVKYDTNLGSVTKTEVALGLAF